MKTFPNAKINLGLNVLRKRPDGYHDLETLFVPYFALQDELEIEESDKFVVEIVQKTVRGGKTEELPVGWNAAEDLTVKAYKSLKKDFALPPVRIKLKKGIPAGAGLGGGSADASFALRMFSEMFDLYLPDALLAEYAASLGSDCPFFIYNRPMLASGRGEELEDCSQPLLDGLEIKVVVPEGVSVSTKEAYAGIVPTMPKISLREVLTLPVEKWRECLKNDFEATVFAVHPSLAAEKERLYSEGAIYASMSGSGSALFGLFKK